LNVECVIVEHVCAVAVFNCVFTQQVLPCVEEGNDEGEKNAEW
jgi:hypothetical protein